jgi:hypothetical protein
MLVRYARLALTLLFAVVAATASAQGNSPQGNSPIGNVHLAEVRAQLAQAGLPEARIEVDAWGRIELKGYYNDEREVDRAFSLAQTVVGVRWVSPVTPENIRVKEWERRVGSLFSRAAVMQPPPATGAPGPVRNRYALVAGVGRFKFGINPLSFAAKDAASFRQFLVDPNRGRFASDNVIYLVDENATRAALLDGLERLKRVAQPDDLVVVYISSHGTPPDKRGAVNVVTYDSEIKPRERIWHTSLTEDSLREFVSGLKAQRLVMVLDTCYSNGAYRAVPGFLPPGGKSLGADDDEGYGISRDYGKRLLGAKDIVLDDTPARAQSKALRIGDTDDAWGKVLIGASGAGERSWESDQLGNSVFTWYFLDGLKRNSGSVQSAFYYAKPLVYERVRAEKGADIEQSPQVMSTQSNWNMKLVTQR